MSDDYDSGSDRRSSPEDVDNPNIPSPSRRRFMKNVGLSGLAAGAATTGIGSAFADEQTSDASEAGPAEGRQRVTFKINGETRQADVAANTVLLDAIRQDLKLPGTKKGCDHGQCGACNVHVNGTVINSCLSLAVMHDGDEITTVEGLGSEDDLGPVQQAFLEHDGYQCGYCTAGQMMTASYVLNDDRIGNSQAELKQAMSGNICRCGAYKNIVAAIQDARGKV
ncbi:2Fe-2S iron-sulfur cluster-binding protein [Salinisphaera sp. SPP-AMP-43]|uniref:(2Fe-2S)-binding protein n=1 Tax=Salinisphaera sp. SPP-AMP-43 TaxID=3121288 RepID=UPI003C6DEC30